MSARPVVLLKGRLGNQLFQWAAAKGLQNDPDAPAVLDNRLRRRFGEPLRSALRPGEFRTVTQLELLRLRQMPRLPWYFQDAGLRGAALSKWLVQLSEAHSWRETDMDFDPAARQNLNKLLLGFFQDERYFAHVADRVHAGFAPASGEAHGAMFDIRRSLRGLVRVALTVRSGPDYDALGWTLPAKYYVQAAERVANVVGTVGFVVTGDMPHHVERLMQLLDPIGPSVPAAQMRSIDQLHVIADQDHMIMANSTFSWWGAWLGDQRHDLERRVTVAPAIWVPAKAHPGIPRWLAEPVTLGRGWQSPPAD